MSHSTHLNALAWAICFAGLSPAFAGSNGGHLGWCIGVGNPHQNHGCTGGAAPSGHQTTSQPPQVTQPTGGTVPSVQTQIPTPQTITVPVGGGTLISDPQGFNTNSATVVVPVLPGGTTVDKQNPAKPTAQDRVPSLTLQATSVAQPPSQGPTSVTLPPAITMVVPALPGGTTVDKQNPATPTAHQAPAISTLQATSVAESPAQVPSSVTRPPAITVVTHNSGAVVQVTPVTTLSRPRPIANPVTGQVPVLAPGLPTQQAPQPVATPQPQQPTVHVTAPVLLPPIHVVANPSTQIITVNPPQPPVVVTQLHPPILVAATQPTKLVTTVNPSLSPGLAMQPHSPGLVTLNQLSHPGTTESTPQPPVQDQAVQPQGQTLGEQMHPATWVVPSPGRQPSHDLPFRMSMEIMPRTTHCLASGFGWRREQRPDGTWRLAGAHPDLRTTDVLVRDIPANHHLHSGCVVEVVRREVMKN